MEMKDFSRIAQKPVVLASVISLIVGLAAGGLVGRADRYERSQRGPSEEGAPWARASRDGDGDAAGGCPMMEGDGARGSVSHRMPDGSTMMGGMMMNDGGSMDMGSMMMDMTGRMKGKSGDELDKVFLEDMIVHHQGAVDMAKLLAAGSKRPEMQKFAADIIRVQSGEIEQMKAWEKSWFGN